MKICTLAIVVLILGLGPALAAEDSDIARDLRLSKECRTEFFGFDQTTYYLDEAKTRAIRLMTPRVLSEACKHEVLQRMLDHPDQPKQMIRPAPIWWSVD